MTGFVPVTGFRVTWFPTLSGRSVTFHAVKLPLRFVHSWHESMCGRPVGEGRGVVGQIRRCLTCKRAVRKLVLG